MTRRGKIDGLIDEGCFREHEDERLIDANARVFTPTRS